MKKSQLKKLLTSQLKEQLNYCSLRWVRTTTEHIEIKQNITQPLTRSIDEGVMACVIHEGGIGYAATSELTENAIKTIISQAQAWAKLSSHHSCFQCHADLLPHLSGEYHSQVTIPTHTISVKEKIDLLKHEVCKLKTDQKIVDWGGSIEHHLKETLLVTNRGGNIDQVFDVVIPNLWVTAHAEGETQTRNLSGGACARQGGWEHIENYLAGSSDQLSAEVLQLLAAENCLTDTTNLLLMPDQMMLQIHESIGHPLELDRILGDERNYAGTSFVTPEMIGSFQYGSELLNVSFDPTLPTELASYQFDDDGTLASKQLLIENGILKRVLGGSISQARAKLPGVANTRAQSWNRPPLDRIVNLNIEAGDTPLSEMIANVEHGILMAANRSWSIDDSRNKFQFGCEWGQMIKNGQLTQVVKNPNYRGISRAFWRNLIAVGNKMEIFGTAYCGKAEPNQLMQVGHASPPCLFKDVEIFGG